MSDKLRFIPVKGVEENILASPYSEGKLYFAIDTKKMYLDANGKNKLPVGGAGNSGIYYGTKEFQAEEDQLNVTFNGETELENEDTPIPDDLILNIPTGSFYRVVSVISSNEIITQRITSAGGGGSSDQPGSNVNLVFVEGYPQGIQTAQTFVYGQSSLLKVKGDVDTDDTTIIYQVTITNEYAGVTTTKTYGPDSIPKGSEYVLDIGQKFALGTNTVQISITSDNAGKTATKKYTLTKCVEMELKRSDDFNPLVVFNGSFNFYCIPIGANLTKKVEIEIDGNPMPSLTKTNITGSNEQLQFNIPAQSHGPHVIKAILTCEESSAQSEISYNICSIESGNNAAIIWCNANTPSEIVNHDALTIEYMVYNPLSTVGIKTHYFINGKEIATSPQEVNYSPTSWLKWRVIGYEIGSNILTLQIDTGEKLPINVEVKPDTKRNLDLYESGLHVNLNAIGRSNNENAQSRQTWTSNSKFDNTTVTEVKFNNFNWYNNGWIDDDEGETCLRISNGASIEIPLQGVLNTKTLQESLAFEFVFKVRNVGHYGTLINTEVNDSNSDIATVTKTVSSTEGVWGSYYKNSVGFCLGTQEAFFKTKNALVSGRFKENELVHLSFVVESAGANSNNNKLIYIYINGINSGITKYNTTTDSLEASCEKFLINSEYCDIDLYKFRVYKTNLTAQYVIQNYLADINDASLYDMNENIVAYKNGVPSIQYLKMLEYNAQQVADSNPDGLLMPYMLVETVANDDQMPYYKCGQNVPWKVNVEFVNPQLDYLYENNLIDSTMLTNYGFDTVDHLYATNAPSFTANGAEINVQGTSSQGYPIRNFKIKLKKATDWNYTKLKNSSNKSIGVSKGGTTKAGYKVGKKYHITGEIGETSYTLKADYMDSSSVHNSGFANLVGTMYSKHPTEDYDIPAEKANLHRTSVFGFPYLMFQKLHTGEGDEKYKFLGRYNMNIDKGADDTFGFCDYGDDSYIDVKNLVNVENYDGSKLYIHATVVRRIVDETTQTISNKETVEYITVKDALACVSAKTQETVAQFNNIAITEDTYNPNVIYYRLDESGDSFAENPDYDETDPYSRPYLPWSAAAECWELQQNQGGRCSFKKANFEEISSSGLLSVLNDFEYRYHIDADSIDNCLNKDHYKTDGIDFSGATAEQVNTYMLKKLSRFEKLVAWLASTDTTAATNAELETSVIYNNITYTTDSAAYRINKFKYEFEQWLDKEYCIIYWIMTELLLCYDSRGKNLMMATWGPHEYGGNDIWYPIFYDIDTQLGVNNSGVPYWDYYEEASDNGTFSTADSVLWNNLWTVFSQDIMAKFNSLTGKQLTVETINGAYSFDPFINTSMAMSGQRPMITINVDEYQKYIAPSISGYINTSNQTDFSDAFYYCLQGTRDLQRQMFLRNRFNYISSKWRSGNYSVAKAKQGVQMRFDANDYPNTSDKYLNTDNPLKYFSKPETVGSVNKKKIIDAASYQAVQAASKDGKIYIKNASGTFDEDTSHTYDGTKAEDYYIKNDYEYAEYPHPLDFVWDFDVTPYLKQYVSNIWDDTQLETQYASDGETVTIPIPENKFNDVMNTANYPQQLVYFGGAEYLSSLGDLSKKYIDQLWISGAYRLKDLCIGSDVPGYWNNMMNTNSFKPDDAATITIDGVTKTNPNAKTLLEKVILTNLTGLTNTIDFSGSEKLKELRALGTNISSFILADGVQIAKLHLPETITNLILKEPTSLTGILTSPDPTETEIVNYNSVTVTADTYNANDYWINTLDGYKNCNDSSYFANNPDYPDFNEETGLGFNETRAYYERVASIENVYPTGLYIEGLTNLNTINDNSVTYLDTIDIIGGNMGYDSYSLLNKTVQIKQKMIVNNNLDSKYDRHLSINLENVDWTPFRQVSPGEVPLDDSIYYIKNDHDELKLYAKTSGEYIKWTLNVANGLVYEYNSELFEANQNVITNLNILDIFLDDYIDAKTLWDSLENKNNYSKDGNNFYQNTDGYAQGPTLANLTGNIYINNDEQHPIDEAKIKNYYNKDEGSVKYYNKLNINAAHIAKANVAKFVEVVNDETLQENVIDTLKYSRLESPVQTYPELTTKVGNKLNYDFRGWSTEYHSQEELNAMSDSAIEALLVTEDSISNLLFENADDYIIKFYAVYTIHSYDITFKNYDETIIDVIKVPFGDYLSVPLALPTKDASDLELTKCYGFKGYAKDKTAKDPINISSLKSTDNMTFYAIYGDNVSVYDNVLSTDYLNISLYESDGYCDIGVKTGAILQGKITLPSYITVNNVAYPVKNISNNGFKGQKQITHIFWENGDNSPLENIYNSGFRDCTSLIYFEMPTSIKWIYQYGFNGCTNFMNTDKVGITDAIIKQFFENIEVIDSYAFGSCSNGFKNATVWLGSKLTKIGRSAFTGAAFTAIIIGNEDNYANLNIDECGTTMFSSCNALTRIHIYCAVQDQYASLSSKFGKTGISFSSGPIQQS